MSALSSILSVVNRLRQGTTQVSVSYPVLASEVSPQTAGVNWTLGAYVQAIAPNVLAAHQIVAVAVTYAANGLGYELEIAQGGAGSEIVIGRLGGRVNANAVGAQTIIPVVPAIFIPANARVAVRVAGDQINTNMNLKLIVLPRPS